MHLSYSLIATFSRSICVMHSYMNANFLWNLVREIQVKTQTNRDRQVEPSTTNEQCTDNMHNTDCRKEKKISNNHCNHLKELEKINNRKKNGFFWEREKKSAHIAPVMWSSLLKIEHTAQTDDSILILCIILTHIYVDTWYLCMHLNICTVCSQFGIEMLMMKKKTTFR